MELSVVFLGTSASIPSARRNTASVMVRAGGDRLLFDCGEGTQRQMQRSTGLVQVDDIYLTHFHADHFLGLPGLIKTYDLLERDRPLRIIGPPGLGELFKHLYKIIGKRRYRIDLKELTPGEAIGYDGYEVRCFPVEHGVRAYGYAVVEDERLGRFDAERAAELGVEFGPDFGRLQRGETVSGSSGPVTPDEVVGEARAGRKIVITGDTRPCEMTKLAAHEAELLIHDGSFTDEEAERAVQTGHSTVREAAELAREAKVALLALVHISSRYHVGQVLEEAREALLNTLLPPDLELIAPRDFDIIEIPFPERGKPVHIDRGARPRRDPTPNRDRRLDS